MREGSDGQDQLLIDPAERGTGKYTAVKPIRASLDGGLLLYEVKQVGSARERLSYSTWNAGQHSRMPSREAICAVLLLHRTEKSFCYVHELAEAKGPHRSPPPTAMSSAATSRKNGIFFAGWGEKMRLCLVRMRKNIGVLVYRFLEKPSRIFYVSRGRVMPRQNIW